MEVRFPTHPDSMVWPHGVRLSYPRAEVGPSQHIVYEWITTTEEISWAGDVEGLLGYSLEEVPCTWRTWLDLIHPSNRARAKHVLLNPQESCKGVHLEYRVCCKNGIFIQVQHVASTIEDNKVVGWIAPSVGNERLDHLLGQCVEASPLGIMVVDEDGKITFANSSLLELFGYQEMELLHQPVEIFLPEALRQHHVNLRHEYSQNPVQRMMMGRELQALKKDGTSLPVAVGLNPLDFEGKRSVAVSVLDLRTIKRAEEDLTRFFNLSLDGMCIAGMDTYFKRVNPRLCQILGYTEQELLNRPFLELIHPEDRQSTIREVDRLSGGEPTIQFRNRYVRKDGSFCWLEWNSMPVAQEKLMFAVARDVTRQIEMEDLLHTREQRERAILDNSSAVIYVKDVNRRYEFINKSFSSLFSISQEEIIGKRDEDIFSSELAAKFALNDNQVIQSGEPLHVDEVAPHADGLHSYISLKVPLRGANGDVCAVAGISTDITDQLRARKAEEELQLAQLMQQRLYPSGSPEVEGYDIAGASFPLSYLCGDYYDYIMGSRKKRLTLAVGDVSGHGLGPALKMVEIRALLRMMLQQSRDLATTVRHVNQMLVEDTIESSFITLFLAHLDLDRRELIFLGAGHDAWLLRPGNHRVHLESTGMPLGIQEIDDIEVSSPITLNPGDVLLLFTDGLVETMSPTDELFGIERALRTVEQVTDQPAEIMVKQLFTSVREFSGGKAVHDDITVIIAKVH